MYSWRVSAPELAVAPQSLGSCRWGVQGPQAHRGTAYSCRGGLGKLFGRKGEGNSNRKQTFAKEHGGGAGRWDVKRDYSGSPGWSRLL
jgi:hypothetical protein